ncbi:hypothetical protein EGT74_27010 [Chitinophaga lutea]|uniref:DUF5362 domain-containing protein n=1 Tax=Chitinophaga lutea TaxID=2488634 RepID=A0A3N4PBE4_9BACT|nr:DUF5362 family protein [Chitinophaga lutea]RPE06002.1 hypothetical protein EGT74_27010 [Chitinophaga lutea]
METNNLLDLQIDPESGSLLSEAAKWGKFLAIVGFVGCGFMLLGGLMLAAMSSTISSQMEAMGGTGAATFYSSGMGTALYIGMAVLYLFPCLYLYRFAGRMQEALRSTDQGVLNSSFANLKSMFKFMGILTIIIIAFSILAFIFAIVAATTLA